MNLERKMLGFFKRYRPIIITVLLTVQCKVICANPSGGVIIGGIDDSSGSDFQSAALVLPREGLTPLGLSKEGRIISVAINSSGSAIIGGADESSGFPVRYAALVSPSGRANPLGVSGDGWINSVAINSFGSAIIGGLDDGVGIQIAVLVSPSGGVTPLGLSTPGGIDSVAINPSGAAIIGGYDDSGAPPVQYAALVSPSGVVSSLGLSADGFIDSVAINSYGSSIIGGYDNSGGPNVQYAALVSPSGGVSSLGLSKNGWIESVAINPSGAAIIGGFDESGGPEILYAAIVSPSGGVSSLGLSARGNINSVAINPSGAAVIGGYDNSGGPFVQYAALVAPNGRVTPLDLSALGNINSVAIIPSGPAIIGGTEESSGAPVQYAALVAPNGRVTPLGLSALGEILSVAISDIDPKSFGPGNTFADPLFSLSTAVLENHLRRPVERESESFNVKDTAGLTASNRDLIELPPSSCQEAPRYALWGSPFGLYARHKKGREFPSLRDRGVGGIIGFDYLGWQNMVLGVGGAYAYQNVKYSDNFGKARVHQEFLTFYGAWYKEWISVQAALWGGLYQMHNTRKTFDFITSKAHVNGWLFSPHLEISFPFQLNDKRFTIEPFVMFDWVNNWQGSVRESGRAGFNLRIDRHYVSLLRSEVGLHFLESFQFKKGDLTFEESLSYVNKAPFNAKRRSAYYVGSISTFNLQMFSDRVVNLGALRLSGRFTPCSLKPPSISLAYQGEFSSKLQSHTLVLEIEKRF